MPFGGGGDAIDHPLPFRALRLGALGPGRRRPPAAEPARQGGEPRAGIGDQGQRAMLPGVEARGVELDQPRLARPERPRAGGEILQPGADGEQHIGLARQAIGGGRAGDADGADIQAMGPGQRALAGLGLGHRYAMALGEGGKLGAGLAVMHPAAAEQKRGLGG